MHATSPRMDQYRCAGDSGTMMFSSPVVTAIAEPHGTTNKRGRAEVTKLLTIRLLETLRTTVVEPCVCHAAPVSGCRDDPSAERESNYPFRDGTNFGRRDCAERFRPPMSVFVTHVLFSSIAAIQLGCVVIGLADLSLPRRSDIAARAGLPRRSVIAKAGVP
jgi:hypothetical protein